ncbi:hypothetical protein E2C01_063926 [Portunus trituberculatus]|uniref:Uncharacterized protein n=1 Tax=Portunus trituberculatus TaxID=210409 RepID=A0A5B7HJH2_PORTR|nr:hypothetical protein [Portunus trituberculatus]
MACGENNEAVATGAAQGGQPQTSEGQGTQGRLLSAHGRQPVARWVKGQVHECVCNYRILAARWVEWVGKY